VTKTDLREREMTVRLLVSGRARVGVTCLLGAVLFLTSPPPPLLMPTMAEAAATAAAAALDVDDEDSKKANIVAARAARVRLAGDDKYFCKPLMVR